MAGHLPRWPAFSCAVNVRFAVDRAIQFHSDGQLAAAVDACRTILKRQPETCACWFNLGMALRSLGRQDEGLAALREGVRVCPRSTELNYNLGNALKEAGDCEGALKHYRAACTLDPDNVKAARACGVMLMRLGAVGQAVEHYAAALGRRPDDSKLCAGLGLALWKLQRPAAAVALRRAVALNPGASGLRRHLHDVLCWLGNDTENEEQLRAGLAREADSPSLLAALAQSLIAQGRLDEGLECCSRALAVDPDHHDARLARGRANFLAGRYAAAWPDRYRQVEGLDRRPKGTSGREWEGQDLAGHPILLYGEQGLGDVIQYARYAPLLVAEGGARVIVACNPRLVGLLRRVRGIDKVVPDDQPPPPTDWYCSLLDVPAVWGHDVDAIPTDLPYLPPRVRQTPVLPPARGFRAGIVWAGDSRQKQNRRRSCRLEDFAPLFELPGTEFVSFQVGPPTRELSQGWRGLVQDPGNALETLEATADALMEVDLVITVDTMLAHLAGALGRPVWTLLAFAPDWRWMLDRADTPWYPTMRLFRQPKPNDWTRVFREVRRELEAHLARAGRQTGMRDQPGDGSVARSPSRVGPLKRAGKTAATPMPSFDPRTYHGVAWTRSSGA